MIIPLTPQCRLFGIGEQGTKVPHVLTRRCLALCDCPQLSAALELRLDLREKCLESFAIRAQVAVTDPRGASKVQFLSFGVDQKRHVVLEPEDAGNEHGIDLVLGAIRDRGPLRHRRGYH